jgi:hypothetical protein
MVLEDSMANLLLRLFRFCVISYPACASEATSHILYQLNLYANWFENQACPCSPYT